MRLEMKFCVGFFFCVHEMYKHHMRQDSRRFNSSKALLTEFENWNKHFVPAQLGFQFPCPLCPLAIIHHRGLHCYTMPMTPGVSFPHKDIQYVTGNSKEARCVFPVLL